MEETPYFDFYPFISVADKEDHPELVAKEMLKQKWRPEFTDKIPKVYQNLVKKCWSEDPSSLPTFDEIVHELKTNPEFITESVDKDEYFKYIKYIL